MLTEATLGPSRLKKKKKEGREAHNLRHTKCVCMWGEKAGVTAEEGWRRKSSIRKRLQGAPPMPEEGDLAPIGLVVVY